MKLQSLFRFLLGMSGTVSASGQMAPESYRNFTVEEKGGRVLKMTPVPDETPPPWARDVPPKKADWAQGPDTAKPFFQGPIPYVIAPVDAGEPFHSHNHQPSIAWLDNGDLLAIWYTAEGEKSTGLTVLASRLRAGNSEWDASSSFFKAPEHNMHGSSIVKDAAGTLHHFNGMAPQGASGWAKLAFLTRTSTDNGVTWTAPFAADPVYAKRHQVITGTLITHSGAILQNCDAVPGMEGGTALQISSDGGKTWNDPGKGKPVPSFTAGSTGEGTIAGIHAGIVELRDGSIMALGRGNNIDGSMPRSISTDMGKTWTYSASGLPPIGSGQRLVLTRLIEGPLLLVSFTCGDRKNPRNAGLTFTDETGRTFTGYGMFAAISTDEGKTWETRRLLTPGSGDHDGGAWTGRFTATPDQAEHAGYLACTQTPDHVIHLISSRLHYRFNLAWIKERSH